MTDHRGAASERVPGLTTAPAVGPAGCPDVGSVAGDDGDPVPAQDGYQRLIMQLGDHAGATGWMADGACRGSDPELFFPVAAAGSAVEQVQVGYAKAVCGRCKVSRECRSYAQRTMPEGIWGGTTREERIALRARAAAHSPGQAD